MSVTRKFKGTQTKLLLSQFFSQLSDRMMQLGLIWMLTTTYGENELTWYLVLGGLPHILFSFFSGYQIQKWGALRVLFLADGVRSLIYFLSAICLVMSESIFHIQKINLIFLYSVIFIANIFSAFFNPAILVLPIELNKNPDDPGVQALTARLNTINSLAIVFGPAIGLFCFQRLGVIGLFFLAGVSYFLSGLVIFQLNHLSQLNYLKKNRRKNILDIQDAKVIQNSQNRMPINKNIFSSLSSNFFIFFMLGVFLLINLLLGPLQVILPSMAKNVFQQSFNRLAWMEMSLGIGIILGGLALSYWTITRRELLWTWFFLLQLSVSYLFLLFGKEFIGVLFSLFIMGLAVGFSNILILNILQHKPKSSDVPNIMSVVNLISTASVPLSLSVIGWIQNQYQYSWISVGIFSAFVLLLVVTFCYYPFHRWGKELFI